MHDPFALAQGNNLGSSLRVPLSRASATSPLRLAAGAGLAVTALVVVATLSASDNTGGAVELAAGTSLNGNFGWGMTNPETGMTRVGCGSSVAFDDRFWGPVGTVYTVECPAHCAHYGERHVYGCNVFLDDSSICRAAIAKRYLGHQNSGIVKFRIEEPIEKYPGCSNMPSTKHCTDFPTCGSGFVEDTQVHHVTSFSWTWHTWKQADKASKIEKYGEEGAKLRYRTHLHGDGYRYGLRAFRIVDGDVNLALQAKVDGDYAEVSNGINTIKNEAPKEITVEAWVRDHAPAGDKGYVHAASEGATPEAPASGWVLGTQDGSFAFGVASQSTGKMSFVVAPKWLTANHTGEWTHLAGTYDGTSILLYVNGVKIGCDETQDGPIEYSSEAKFLVLGRSKGAVISSPHADIDEIRVWKVVKDGAELGIHMHKTLPEPIPSDVKIYWRYDGQDTTSKSTCGEVGSWSATMHGGLAWLDSGAPVEMLGESSHCKAV